jgi:hypothetical protein
MQSSLDRLTKTFCPETTRCCHIFQIIERIFGCVVNVMTTARRNYYINWCCNRWWMLEFVGWLAEPEGKVHITQGNFRLVFTEGVSTGFTTGREYQLNCAALFQYVLLYCSLHEFIKLCQSVHIHNKKFIYWFNVFHPKLWDEWLLTVWLLAQLRLSSDTLKLMQVINKPFN